MLELSDAKPSDKTSEEAKRKKAKLLKKLKEKESLVNANKQVKLVIPVYVTLAKPRKEFYVGHISHITP